MADDDDLFIRKKKKKKIQKLVWASGFEEEEALRSAR